jgi:hypothetical protein
VEHSATPDVRPQEEIVTELETEDRPADYAALGYVANPFPPVEETAGPLWRHLTTHAAANALLSAARRAADTVPSDVVVVTTDDNVPDDYPRAALNDFLRRSANDTHLGMMSLNIPLTMMRLGRIRGTLAAMAELVAAVDLEKTVAAYLVSTAADPDADLAHEAGVTEEEIADAIAGFACEPVGAVARVFGRREEVPEPSRDEESEALHRIYLRGTGLDPDPSVDQEGVEAVAEMVLPEPATGEVEVLTGEGEVFDANTALRDYFLAYMRVNLSTLVARALASYRDYGSSVFAQELKITKAPRKTLGAALRFMQPRWPRVVVLYDGFEVWNILDETTKADIVDGMNELNGIIGRTGVMGLVLVDGQTPELAEAFAGGVPVDWKMGEIAALQQGAAAFDAALVRRWLDAAAFSGVSRLRADGPQLAPLVDACADDVFHFACMAEAAVRDAAERGVSTLDPVGIAAGIASVTVTEADR